jgi:NADPH-dependent 2,4-dienoyl-CoA reductase/sulfur reductase-like enzyme
MNRRTFDVLIIGAGPAGLAAARRARESGRSVAIVDDNPVPGGQIWRSVKLPEWGSPPGLPVFTGARVIAAPRPNCLSVETSTDAFELAYRSLILATGARERFLPFPGWTLPHVAGAGGLQALAKSGLPIAGKRVVIAGSGPLLLAVARYLKDHGASVRLVAEQAELSSLLRFAAMGLAAHPTKLLEAVQFRSALRGIPYLSGCWPAAAEPGSVTLRRVGKTWTEPCDYLACGFGLIPNTELAALLGCRIGANGVEVSDEQQTSVPGVYAAGEVTGIGGLELSLAEGEIAGCAAAGRPEEARRFRSARASARRFAAALEAFALREELKALAGDTTLVCRCEDVTLGRIRAFGGWREAKLHTRCGMGACQGRVCGGAVEFLLGWKAKSVRPPIFPARIGSLK